MPQHEISLDRLQDAFSETYPRYTENEAVVEANRCLYCFDAPCIAACPTGIDVPTFIRKIATGNVLGAATTILESNLMGHSCGRVCPVDELCVGACVLGAEHRPIAIGRLQRYATDHLFERGAMPFTPAPATGKKVAVVGGGPAGLSCAGELAKRGIAATVFERQELPGGLSTYGIVVLREPVQVSLEEVSFVERLGVEVRAGVEVGVDTGADSGARSGAGSDAGSDAGSGAGSKVSPQHLLDAYDAVVIAAGTGPVPKLGVPGEDAEGVIDALPFIAATKMADKDGVERLRDIPVGNEVVVVGAGNTAIDAATVAKRLGAERVTMVYRRGREEMPAYDFEVAFVQNEGVDIRLQTQPVEVITEGGRVTGLRCVRMALGEPGSDGRRRPEPVPGSEFVLPCDQVIKAIGQEKLVPLFEAFGVETLHGYVRTDAELRTSNPKVFAAGDCVRSSGHALTVTAAQDGKIAAAAIAAQLGVPEPAPETVTGRAILGNRHAAPSSGVATGSAAHG